MTLKNPPIAFRFLLNHLISDYVFDEGSEIRRVSQIQRDFFFLSSFSLKLNLCKTKSDDDEEKIVSVLFQ